MSDSNINPWTTGSRHPGADFHHVGLLDDHDGGAIQLALLEVSDGM